MLSRAAFAIAFILAVLGVLVLVHVIAIGGATGWGLLVAAVVVAVIGWFLEGGPGYRGGPARTRL